MPDRRAEAQAFLEALFGSQPDKAGGDLRIALWSKAGKKSSYAKAALGAASMVQGRGSIDLYVSVALAPRDLGSGSRVKNTTAAGIAGMWADLDVVGGPEGKKGVAPSLEAALELAREILPPTLTVTSGYGLQAWWLLEDGPWVFRTVEERETAARMAAGWMAVVDHAAAAQGWRFDHTQDLARLMRLPGTLNGKGGLNAPVGGWPTPVTEQLAAGPPRYSLEQLQELAFSVAPRASYQAGGTSSVAMTLDANEAGFDPNASPPADKLLALRYNRDQFKRTWRHTRRDGASWSMSEWDLSLATQAISVDWSDDEVLALLAMHRREHGGEKLDRPDYFLRTLAKAKRQIRTEHVERQREDALEELEEHADETRPDPDATISAFNRVVGGPLVKEFVQDGRDPQTARFTLVLANGEPVRLGRIGDLMSIDRFRGSFAVVTGHVLPKVKPAKWDSAVQALLKIRQVRESEDDTPEGQVVDWLSRYLYERLPPNPGEEAKDAACRSKEPFSEDGQVYVYSASFAGFVRQALRVNVPDHEVKDMLRAAGFERRTVHYQREDGSTSTRSYYAGQKESIE